MRKALNIIWRLLVIALAILLIAKVIHHTGADMAGDLRQARPTLLAAAFGAYGLIMVLNAVRWQLLLKAQSLPLPFADAFRLSMAGFFFNCILPGAVSGDIIKIAMASRHHPDSKTEVALSIFLDRLLGMFGLFLAATLATVASPWLLSQLQKEAPRLLYAVVLVNLGTLGALVFCLLFLARQWFLSLRPVAACLAWLGERLPGFVVRLCQRIDAALTLYQHQKRALGAHLLISVAIHLLCAVTILSIGRALGEQAMAPMQYNLTIQVADAIGALPVTPAGLGLRDTVSASFLQCFGINPPGIAGSIPVFFSLVMFSWALLGALALCTLPDHRPSQDQPQSPSSLP